MRTETNKLIAEFMGGQRVLPNEDYYCMPTHNNLCYAVSELEYHTSWDWLMPVIDKIESFIFDENNSYNVTIGSTNYCVIQDSNGDTIEISKGNGNSKLDTTYQAVVEFIKQAKGAMEYDTVKELKKLVSLFEHRKLWTNDSILMVGDLKKLIDLTDKL
jgi:hypothetical protein